MLYGYYCGYSLRRRVITVLERPAASFMQHERVFHAVKTSDLLLRNHSSTGETKNHSTFSAVSYVSVLTSSVVR